ncbi:MAG TPA: hypothetical protein DCX54_13120 [Flavobacteriales bacterium]|nr:hypothetical protein [Flavobacteriales bacterium]
MYMTNSFQPQNRKEWRKWLSRNHSREKEVWLIYVKKSVNKPTISYDESVEEAICFGWIDGIKKKVDEERYTHRFTVRSKKSSWSQTNIERARIMIREKKMTRAGLEYFERRALSASSSISSERDKLVLGTEFERILKADSVAWSNFLNLPAGCRRQYIAWLNNAKREETRQKRLIGAIELLRQNKKLGMR